MRKSIKLLILALMVTACIEGLVAVAALVQLAQQVHTLQPGGLERARIMASEQVDNTYYAGN